jgi:hypothetical protein
MRIHRRGLAAFVVLLAPLTFMVAAPATGTGPGDPPDPTAPALVATPLSPASRVKAFKADSSALAQTSPGLLDRTGTAPVAVMIKLDQDSLSAYRGGVDGLQATSPSVTGHQIQPGSAAVRAYQAYLDQNERAFTHDLAQRVPAAHVTGSYRTVYGGVSATVPANSVRTILGIDGVVAVQKDALRQPLTDSSPEFLNAGPVYAALGGNTNAGAGVIYGNLDTGVWPEHPSFADQGNLSAPPGPARACDFGDNPLTPAVDPFVCQHKLIGGGHFTDAYDATIGDDPFAGTARDSEGHGTHTASTAAGNVLTSAPVFGVDRGPLAGLAPGAWVMEYKVCGPQGCLSSDSARAVEQAIVDGVSVINYSISGGTDPMTDPVELSFLDAYAAGLFVAASAGNDGPGAGTANHLSPWVTTVGASTQRREFATTLHLTADNGETFTANGASITGGVGPLPVVLSSVAPYSNANCSAPAVPGTFTGKIVACQRGGGIGRVQKGFNVRQGGAAGMVLYNPTLADVETDNHWLPTVHLADGTDFVAFMGSHTGVTGQFAAGEKRDGQGDVMAAFSSRGPAGAFIKPDVTAPGVQILAGHTPVPNDVTGGPPGELFQAIAGTSMSSPHVAGAALLLRDTHPGWSPGQVKSALMTRSLTDVLKEDLTTPADPFDMGAGRIDIGRSDVVPLTFDETAARYAALTGDPVHAVDLNVPSINAPVLPGRLTTTRVVRNVSGTTQRFVASATAPAGSSIKVSPASFSVDPGATRTLSITITTDAPQGAQQFGEIQIRRSSGASRSMHLPVAWIRTQGAVTLDQSCVPDSIRRGDATTCSVAATNQSFENQTVSLDTTTSANLTITSASGATVLGPHRARKGPISLAGAQNGVPSVASGELFGYIPLDAFGITPVAIGDEEIVNFNVPAYRFNGKTYTAVGVDSNGYLVAGGGSSEDNECCNLPPGPDPAPPNTMMAPFWTDLDGTGAPGIFAGTLTDGVDTWLVVEYRVNVFGTNSGRVFQVWIGVNGTQDITYAYDPANLPANPNGQPLLVGAENETGQGAMVATLPTGDLRVTSTDPVPGDTVTYTLVVRGDARGPGQVTTEMNASGVPGTTIVKTPVQVTRR